MPYLSVALIAICMVVSGCTVVSGGGSSETPIVTIVSPSAGDEFHAGETVAMELDFDHFIRVEPPQGSTMLKANWVLSAHEEGAVSGYYRVYLDGAEGDEDHASGATRAFDYSLPADLAVGPHKLRVELWSADDEPLGVEASVEIDCIAE